MLWTKQMVDGGSLLLRLKALIYHGCTMVRTESAQTCPILAKSCQNLPQLISPQVKLFL
jgi:hypothetical protein